MSDDKQPKQRSEADAELEREIREGRKFTLEEAIGRMAGPGAMKGESPITRMQQAEIEIGSWLRSHLTDAGGALEVVLHRRVKGSELLLNNFDQPLGRLGQLLPTSSRLGLSLERSCSRSRHRMGTCDARDGPTSKRREYRLTRTTRTRSSRFASLCHNSSRNSRTAIRRTTRPAYFTIRSDHSVCLASSAISHSGSFTHETRFIAFDDTWNHRDESCIW